MACRGGLVEVWAGGRVPGLVNCGQKSSLVLERGDFWSGGGGGRNSAISPAAGGGL